MSACPACARSVTADDRFCPACGRALGSAVDLTVTSAGSASSSAPSARPAWLASAPAGPEWRFLPGAMIAGRYRVSGPLGRGGMGEVYRADDLKLGQAVALKFLPREVERDAGRLARLLQEVKIARQISHPNVCRVYDVEEVDGNHFIAMEYVDGEDLAGLLRRIGRLPRDKAVEIGRQLCAGLAAAHEQGIVHRDLKPANVMIDGRGRARLTDFGLAGLADAIQGAEVRSGTPAYMAPEQLRGEQVGVKSDLYALGLVLYELLTGQPPFKASSVAELQELQSGTAPAQPSELVEGIDPALERAILRCLEPDPRDRPSSALAVAAALPGGDPLAAALAAGETPSPELVAAAGGEGALSPGVACLLLLGSLAGFALVLVLSRDASLLHLAAPAKPTAVLVERAREVIRELGYDAPPVDHAGQYIVDADYVRWIGGQDPAPDRWRRLLPARPGAVFFWYRESPRRLVPSGSEAIVRYGDPPPNVSGMTFVMLDAQGRLVSFEAVPPQVEPAGEGASAEPPWETLFRLAGLAPTAFTPVDPGRTPLQFADRRAAWEGRLAERPDLTLRVEAATHRGKPVYFELLGPWSRAERMVSAEEPRGLGLARALNALLIVGVLVAAATLARRNLRAGRGDRRGAGRLALYMFGVGLVGTLLSADHTTDPAVEWEHFVVHAGVALFLAGLAWLLYLALEPFVRRRWPTAIIGWSRLIAGRLRDPRVGREILAGAVGGAAQCLVFTLYLAAPPWLGTAGGPPRSTALSSWLLGGRHVLADILGLHLGAIVFGLIMLFFMFLGVTSRPRWVGLSMFMAVSTLMNFLFLGDGPTWLRLAVAVAASAIVVAMFLRAGVLAAVCAQFLGTLARRLAPDFGAWYGGWYVLGALVVLAVVAFGFHTALGGRPLFGRRLAQPSDAPSRP